MIEAVILAALTLPQVPGDAEVPKALEGYAIDVVVQATETHFLARNQSHTPLLLLFGASDRRLVSTVPLGPGGQVVYPFSRGATDELLLEIVLFEADAWRNTGALSIANLNDTDAASMWVVGGPDHAVGWTLVDQDLLHARPRTGLVPAPLMRAGAGDLFDFGDESATAPTHVPVVTPSDTEGGEDPPVIKKKRLPPV